MNSKIFNNHTINILFLIIFGYVTYSFKQVLIDKSNILFNKSVITKFIINADSYFSFFYPIFYFTFFYVLFNSSSFIIIGKTIKKVSHLIILSMIPNFVYLLINFYYVVLYDEDMLKQIIEEKQQSLIPFINYHFSIIIANYLVYLIPPLFVMYELYINKKYSLMYSAIISFLPIIIILVTLKYL